MKLTISKKASHCIVGALAIALPLAILVAAKSAASWRLVKVGELSGNDRGCMEQMPSVAASDTQLIAGFDYQFAWFDLRTGQRRRATSEFQSITTDGSARWLIKEGTPCRLIVDQNGQKHTYQIPAAQSRVIRKYEFEAPLKVSVTPDRVEVLSDTFYLRWAPESPQAVRCVDLKKAKLDETSDTVLTGDGEKVIAADEKGIYEVSTQSGHIVKRTALGGAVSGRAPINPSWVVRFSPLGSYAICYITQSDNTAALCAVDTSSGRTLWTCNNTTLEWVRREHIAISRDEKFVAVPSEGKWEIYDLTTGQLQRTFSSPPDLYLEACAFSPDGNTFYSVASGIVYRQRVR